MSVSSGRVRRGPHGHLTTTRGIGTDVTYPANGCSKAIGPRVCLSCPGIQELGLPTKHETRSGVRRMRSRLKRTACHVDDHPRHPVQATHLEVGSATGQAIADWSGCPTFRGSVLYRAQDECQLRSRSKRTAWSPGRPIGAFRKGPRPILRRTSEPVAVQPEPLQLSAFPEAFRDRSLWRGRRYGVRVSVRRAERHAPGAIVLGRLMTGRDTPSRWLLIRLSAFRLVRLPSDSGIGPTSNTNDRESVEEDRMVTWTTTRGIGARVTHPRVDCC